MASLNVKKILKVTTGIIVVPTGIAASLLWPWWTKQRTPVKVVTGVVVLPFVAIFGLLSDWWDGY